MSGTHTSINPNYQPAGSSQYGHAQDLRGQTSRKLAKRARMDGKEPVGRDAPNRGGIEGAVEDLLGTSILTPVMSRNLDLFTGYPHSTTGIPYAIQGTAKVIQVGVSEYLAGFSDPIKTILGTSVHRDAKVIITRKYVVGGRSLITPEHAPARTVAIQEDAREVMMTRYGGDIEMNLNLFLRPEDAKEELDLKIAAQRRELERTLVEHGYSVLMEEGTDIVDAIIRSNPSYSTETGAVANDVRVAAERINLSTVFGAMSKHRFPVQNLMAAAKYASAYSTSNERGTVLLLPHASTDLLRSTRRENMVYSISGPDLLQRNKGRPIDMQFEDSYVDPSTNVRIVIHRPFPTFQSGVANPDVGPGPLTDVVSFASYYVLPPKESADAEVRVVDFNNRCWHNLGNRTTIIRKGFSSNSADDPKGRAAAFRYVSKGEVEGSTPYTDAKGGGDWSSTKLETFVDKSLEAANNAIDAAVEAEAGEAGDEKRLEASMACTILMVARTILANFRSREKKADPSSFDDQTAAAEAVDEVLDDVAKVSGDDDIELVLLRPRMNAVMSSGILAAPGAETGELLVGYPFTSVSTSSTEIVKIQLRVYLGAVMKRPENVILLRNIFFEGLREGSGTELFENGYAGVGDDAPGNAGDLTVVMFPKAYLQAHSRIDYADFTNDAILKVDAALRPAYFVAQAQLIALGLVTGNGLLDAELLREGVPAIAYQGACEHRKSGTDPWTPQQKNNGHLGILDDPALADRLFGTFVYSDAGGAL